MIALEAIWGPEAQQRVYRGLLQAMSYPGEVIDLSGPLERAPAILGVLAALVDNTTTLADPDGLLDADTRRKLEAPLATVEESAFVVADGNLPPGADFRPRVGDPYRPDLGATVLLRVEHVGGGPDSWTLTGPGIEETTRLRLGGLAPTWFDRRSEWVANFPMGVDFVICDSERIVALPRTTEIHEDSKR